MASIRAHYGLSMTAVFEMLVREKARALGFLSKRKKVSKEAK